MSSDDDPAPQAATGVATAQPKSAADTAGAPGAPAPAPPNAIGSMGAPAPVNGPGAAERQRTVSDPEPPSKLSDSDSGPTRANSFWQSSSSLSLDSQTSTGESANGASRHHGRPSRWSKARSTSTESSLSLSGITNLGSVYNQDGFPNYPVSSDDDRDITQLAMDDAAIAKQLALTDEAVRSINGTASVVSAQGLGMPIPPPSGNTYELPRSMAAFVRRPGEVGARGDIATGRSFVSSGSSTSSEESEHLASVQWVNSVSTPSGSYPSTFYPNFYNNNNNNNQQPNRSASSPKMPPPASTSRKMASPGGRRNGVPLPSGSAQGTPTQAFVAPGSAPVSAGTATGGTPIAGVSAEGSPDNDDDDQTVGGLREGSPSSSSASGLDLLSHAAAHHERTRYSSQTKRKAGAEAVAQWRESGIPSGPMRRGEVVPNPGGYDSPGYESTPSADGQPREDQGSEPPKKRRKSEMQLEAPDARLRPATHEGDEAVEGDSEYESASASESEYHGAGGVRGVRKPKAKNRKPRVRSTLAVPPAPPATNKPNSSGSKKGPKSAAAAPKARRMSETSAKGGDIAGGVQCDYVNPLPPYQRCPDVFTRKYDIPRHMARHARREGDLVAEGKLPEEKALLWKTIRDKPRIRCKTCGEYFTRQDALKRHQAKQHHH